MGQSFLKLAIVGLLIVGGGFIYKAVKSASDPCELAKLQTSQIEINAKQKSKLKLHLDYGFGKKLKKYLPYIQGIKTEVVSKKRWESRPAMVVLTTHFKSTKSAKSAYRYLQRKWEGKKKSEHEVVLKDKSVIWFRNSYSTNQCFYKAVNITKERLGIEAGEEKEHVVKKEKRSLKQASKKKKSKKVAKGHF